MTTYSWNLIKLVGIISDIKERDSDNISIGVVVGPVCDSGRQRNDVTSSESSNLLVLVWLEATPHFPSRRHLLRFLVSFRTPWSQCSNNTLPFDDVNKLRRVGERRQVKAIGLDGYPKHGYTCTLELVFIRVPGFNYTCLVLYAVVWLKGFKPVELALISLLLLLLVKVAQGQACCWYP